MTGQGYDFDWMVIGSGFGGSVSALRLAEKGYSVGVLECGRRFTDADFATSTLDARRYLWMPRLGMRGILRISIFKDVTILSGAGVGGGSLGYANTLYVAPDRFYSEGPWAGIQDWKAALAPHYEEAKRMLGVTMWDRDDAGDMLLREYAEAHGVADTYSKTPVGVFLGEPGKTVPDPFFGGEGPDRTGCISCGRCMVGCPHGAKNTLVKNYLYFAEKRGVRVIPDRLVVNIKPLGAEDGSDGYEVTSVRAGYWMRPHKETHRVRGVVLSAGALGTNRLLQNCRLRGSLPRISSRLGELVRTNSEAILAVTAPDDAHDFTKRIAITSSVYPDADTHIETVTYGHAGNSMSMLFSLLTDEGTRLTRPLKLLRAIVTRPREVFGLVFGKTGWSRRTVILLVMQTLDNAIALRPRRTRGGWRLQTEQDPDRPNPTFIPVANQAAEWFGRRMGGIAQSSVIESMANIPTTAHILGGVVIADSPERGVVDSHQRVFGYENLLVCDGSVVPANPGVNPSLTITALAEYAMSQVREKDTTADARPGTPAAA